MSQHRERAASIVAGMSLSEKIALVSGADFWTTESLPGLPGIMLTDGPHGLRKQAGDTDHVGLADSVPATCFPPAVTLGSTWDVALVEDVGAALGRESRAEEVGVLLGPGLNLKRHPAGGRSFEYLSEDPFLSGTLAAALTRGIQSEGVGACLKHFAVNNQETARMRIDAVLDERTMRELYLTGFEVAVREGKPWTVMSAYNQINGTHAGESRDLLTTILREEWGFDGLVMTDWLATFDRPSAIHAGVDLEMPGSQGAWDSDIRTAIEAGTLSEADLDLAATRVAHLIVRAHAEREARGAGKADHDAHHALARRAAAAGAVLLTNDGLLPLEARGTIAVIGAFAETPRYQGAGSSQVQPTRLDTFLTSLRELVGTDAHITYAPGYDASTGEASADQIAVARDVAAAADVVVVLVGLPGILESEGYDRTTLELPEGHTRLVDAVLDSNDRTAVVLCNGAAVELPWADRPAALLEAYLGGQAGGSALADVVLGITEPGGRLAESFPEHGTHLAAAENWPGGPTQVEYREGLYVGYRFHDTAGVPARFPFGHGLSYTTFSYGKVSAAVSGAGAQTSVTVSLTVKNTGDRAGSDVVQVYVRDPQATLYRPLQELKGFTKVHLEPGKSSRVSIVLDARALAVWDTGASDWVIEARTVEVAVGSSSTAIRATATVPIASDQQVSAAAKAARMRPSGGASGYVATDAEFTAMLGRPVPSARPLLPFTIDSTLGDLEQTRVGRVVLKQVTKAAGASFGADADEQSSALMAAMMREMPLRGIAMASQGKLDMVQLRRLVTLLNATRWLK